MNKNKFSENYCVKKYFKNKLIPLSIMACFLEGIIGGTSLGAMEPNDFVDLREREILKPLLAEQFQDERHILGAHQIVKRAYEAKTRCVGEDNKYGLVFPIHPEILKDLMISVKEGEKQGEKKTVLEIGGASGENSVLLAFAGANKVYLNDIAPKEIQAFEDIKNGLPDDIKPSLESIEGSVFDLLDLKPELQRVVDLILCRNVLHFFKDEDLPRFFNVLETLSKPGTEIVLTVNAPYHIDDLKLILENEPTATRFNQTRGLFTKNGEEMPSYSYFEKFSLCHEDVDPLIYTKFRLGALQKTQVWRNNSVVWDSHFIAARILGVENNKKVEENKDLIEKNIKEKGYIGDGVISYLETTARLYTQENLSSLFENNGFHVQKTFLIENNGHRLNNDVDPWSGSPRAQQVGIVARKL